MAANEFINVMPLYICGEDYAIEWTNQEGYIQDLHMDVYQNLSSFSAYNCIYVDGSPFGNDKGDSSFFVCSREQAFDVS